MFRLCFSIFEESNVKFACLLEKFALHLSRSKNLK